MDQNTSRKLGGIFEVIRAFVLSALYIMLAFWVSLLFETPKVTRDLILPEHIREAWRDF